MKCKSTALLWASGLFWTVLPICTAAAPQKDYLSALEADKIRDAETPNERIRLFLTFAEDRKSTRLNSSHVAISYAVFCLKKKNNTLKTAFISAHNAARPTHVP